MVSGGGPPHIPGVHVCSSFCTAQRSLAASHPCSAEQGEAGLPCLLHIPSPPLPSPEGRDSEPLLTDITAFAQKQARSQ